MIRKAKASELKYISDLAIRSKAHWGYSDEFLEKCRPHLKVDDDYLEKWPIFVYKNKNDLIGFYSLKVVQNENRLDNLWIEPKFIKKGIGKKLFLHSIESAKAIRWNYFRLASESRAVEFYTKMGATIIGDIESKLDPKLLLTHIEYKFHN